MSISGHSAVRKWTVGHSQSLVRESRGEALVGFVAASVGGVNDGVDEIEIAVTAYQHITINGIEDVVLTVGVVFAIVLWVEAETYELVVNLLLSSEAGITHKLLHQNRADLTVDVLGKAYHAIGASIEIFIMSLDALEERSKVVIGISEIVEFDDILTIGREIRLVLRASVEEITKLAAVAEPAALLLCPLAESYQVDCLASRCSRKSLNLLKHSSRESGCASQYAILCLILAFTIL